MTSSKDKTAKSSPVLVATAATDRKSTAPSTAATSHLKPVQAAASATKTKTSDDAWQKRVAAAHKVWSKLSESELKKSAGEPARLAELVQMRYSISRPDADKQVKNFIDNRS